MENKDDFVYVREINGMYQAVHMWFNDTDPEIPEGFWEPWSSGFHWPTKEEATRDGQDMAEHNGIIFRWDKEDGSGVYVVQT